MFDKNLLKELRPYKHQSGVIVFLDVLRTVAVIARCFCLADIIDKMIFSHLKMETAVPYLTLLFFFFVMEIIADLLISFFAHGISTKIKGHLRRACIDRLTHGSPFGALQKSDSLTLLTDGIGSFEPYFAKFLPALLTAAVLPVLVIGVAFCNDWLSGAIFLGTLPLIPFFMFLIGKRAQAENERQWRLLTSLSNRFMDLISGIMVIKIYNRSKAELENLDASGNAFAHSVLRVLRIAFLSAFFIELIATLSIAVLAVDIAFRLLDGQLTFFPAIFILLMAPEFYQPLRTVSSMFHEAMGALVNATKLYGALDTERSAATGGNKLAIEQPQIVFENVSFSYEQQARKAIHDINLTIEPGTTTALIGRSGAGKSTIFGLLLKFAAPDGGKITVGGTDLQTIDRQSWYKNIALVPQSAHIFRGSLKENICMGQDTATPEALAMAIEQAGLAEWVAALPKKLDTMLGSGFRSVSEGQKRRIALARAFLADAPLLLLDEPMEGIDSATEASIQKSIDELAQGKTVILIAHRLDSIQKAKQIYVLDEGTVIESGDHETLCQNQGLYFEMLNNMKEDAGI